MAVSPSKYTKSIHYVVDFIIVNFAFFDGYFLNFGNLDILQDSKYLLFVLFFNASWFIIGNAQGAFDFNPLAGVEKVIISLFRLFGLHILFVSFFYVFIAGYEFTREYLLNIYSILFVVVLASKLLLFYILKFYRTKVFHYKSVAIIGYGEAALELSKFFGRFPDYGYRFLGFFHHDVQAHPDVLGTLDDLPSFVENIQLDEIFVSLPDAKSLNIDALEEFADNNIIRLKLLPEFKGIAHRSLVVDLYEGLPILSFRNLPLDDVLNRFIKRSFDLVFSSLVILCILSWLLPLVAILIKISSPGPVFFRQKRTGKDNQDFWCLKFRSMRVNKDSDKKQAYKGDNRITGIGKFLRKTSLDEFPQFINVFVGDMSIVGPRPHMLKHTEEYSQIIRKYMVRHFVKPGITGLAQVRGYRGETTDPTRMQGRVRFDIFYIENWSFILDLKIIALTVINVLVGEENAG